MPIIVPWLIQARVISTVLLSEILQKHYTPCVFVTRAALWWFVPHHNSPVVTGEFALALLVAAPVCRFLSLKHVSELSTVPRP